MKRLLLASVLAAGCTKPNPALSCENGLCTDPVVPFCDVTGSIGGEPNTCIHVSCTPNEFAECRDDKALTCNSSGDDYELVTCPYGCNAEMRGCNECTTPECEKHIIPRYVPGVCDSLATDEPLTISTATTIDTSDDSQCTFLVQQAQGVEICVIHHSSITIDRNIVLQIVGTRAVALVADRMLLVDGILDASGRSSNAPGSDTTVSGGTSGNTIAGGGAGGRVRGGSAGTTTTGGAANGGAAVMNPLAVTALFGGARSDDNNGNGGGALTLVSCRGTVDVPGLVDVGGGGGKRGYAVQGTLYKPRGGGAGGTAVLQGMQIRLTGQLFANGGGGGGGGVVGTDGQPGSRSTSAALGGSESGGADGGAGGTDSPPGDGKTNGTVGGAGGGAAGFLLTYTPSGVTPSLVPMAISPSLEPLQILPTN